MSASKTLKRLSLDAICEHLEVYGPDLLKQLPNLLKTRLLEQVLRQKLYSDILVVSIDRQHRVCQCQFCNMTTKGLELKSQMCSLLNPEVTRVIWVLEDVHSDLALLSQCRRLHSLHLVLCHPLRVDTVSSDASFTRLLSVLPNLTEFKIQNVDRGTASLVTDEIVVSLCRSCRLLFSLGLPNCERLTGVSVWAMSTLSIRFLDLSDTRFSDATFNRIASDSPLLTSLSELKLRDCLFLTDAIVDGFLVRCQNLILLNCLGCVRLQNFDALFVSNPKIQIYFTYGF